MRLRQWMDSDEGMQWAIRGIWFNIALLGIIAIVRFVALFI